MRAGRPIEGTNACVHGGGLEKKRKKEVLARDKELEILNNCDNMQRSTCTYNLISQ